MIQPPAPQRFVLWIDAVGGFLVCLADEVRLGQAVPGNQVEVPLVADVSRHELTIRRDASGYVAGPARRTLLGGQPLDHPAPLGQSAQLRLGAVELIFRKPHPFSASARIDFVSHHTTRPRSDAVLLMADSCVLGPQDRSHVVCRDWQDSVVLFRRDGGMMCQSSGQLEIDGVAHAMRGPIGAGSRVVGPGFAFSLEELR